MPEADQRTRDQITDLFNRDNAMSEKLTIHKERLDRHEAMITGINKTNQNLEAISDEIKIVLFGDQKLGIAGMVADNKSQSKSIGDIEKWIWRVGAVSAAVFAILKFSGALSNIFNG